MARLDTHWHAHPKVLVLGLAGMGLHAWCISYCDDLLTDGFVPKAALPAQLPGFRQALQAMLAAGRLEPVEGGYQLHDYLEHNRSRQKVLAKRRQDASRRNGLPSSAAGDSGATHSHKRREHDE